MSFLYDKRTKKAITWIWAVIAVLIILSMVFAFSGGAGPIF
jgi:predicted nucleic acid-binding Zn ribbon protein